MKLNLDKWFFISWLLVAVIGYIIHYFSDLPLYAFIGIVIIAFLGNSYMIKAEDKEEYK
jgi:putative Mn2+ efflux pump MntP